MDAIIPFSRRVSLLFARISARKRRGAHPDERSRAANEVAAREGVYKINLSVFVHIRAKMNENQKKIHNWTQHTFFRPFYLIYAKINENCARKGRLAHLQRFAFE